MAMLDELQERAATLADPANDCESCLHEMPGVLAPMLPDGEETHAFVERCDNCQVYEDDAAAAEAIAARLSLNVHKRYDTETLEHWRPFLTRTGDPDDHDYYGINGNEFGCWPDSEVLVPTH